MRFMKARLSMSSSPLLDGKPVVSRRAQHDILGLPLDLEKRRDLLQDGVEIDRLPSQLGGIHDLHEAIGHSGSPVDLRLEHVEAPHDIRGGVGYPLPQEGYPDHHGV